MTSATKEAERKAVATRRPTMEILARANYFEQWFDRLAEDFWRRPFCGLLRPERWWPIEGSTTARTPAVDVYEGKDDIVVNPPRYADFELELPDGPGLGLTLDEDKLNFYRRDR